MFHLDIQIKYHFFAYTYFWRTDVVPCAKFIGARARSVLLNWSFEIMPMSYTIEPTLTQNTPTQVVYFVFGFETKIYINQ